MMGTPLYKKAIWIAEELGRDIDVDDVYDVLLDNIIMPSQFVASVRSKSYDYDLEMERGRFNS